MLSSRSLPPMCSVDRGAPIAAIARRSAIIHICDQIAALHQELMEHVFARVVGPHAIHVLQIARAVHEQHRRPALAIIRRLVNVRPQHRAIARSKRDDRRVQPRILPELGRGRRGQLLRRRIRSRLLRIQLRRLVGVGINIGEPAIVGRRHDTSVRRAAQSAGVRAPPSALIS